MNRCVAVVLIFAVPGASLAACPTWPAVDRPNARFTLNDTGTEVKDNRTGVVWKRCSEGQVLSANTCTGSAAAYSHKEALENAKQQSGWRLPNVKELASLADKGCINPAIDSSAFPNTSSTLYWTSTPYVSNSQNVWYVDYRFSGVFYLSRDLKGAVRLVRVSQ